jgi:hypothetical protein
MIEFGVAVITGIAAMAALPAPMALLAACGRMEFSQRSAVGVVMTVACLWCIAVALHQRASVPEMLLMLVTASQSVSALRNKRTLRRVNDLSPFA